MKKYYLLLFVAGLVVTLDQWTKWLVRTNIPLNGSWLPESLLWLSPYARLVFVYNSGAAFGMFQNGNLIFTTLAVLVLVGILVYYSQIESGNWSLRLAASLYLSGALGNLIDRLTLGKVTDFISIGAFHVFNVADSSITVGVIVLLLGVWVKERQEKRKAVGQLPVSSDQSSNTIRQEQ